MTLFLGRRRGLRARSGRQPRPIRRRPASAAQLRDLGVPGWSGSLGRGDGEVYLRRTAAGRRGEETASGDRAMERSLVARFTREVQATAALDTSQYRRDLRLRTGEGWDVYYAMEYLGRG